MTPIYVALMQHRSTNTVSNKDKRKKLNKHGKEQYYKMKNTICKCLELFCTVAFGNEVVVCYNWQRP